MADRGYTLDPTGAVDFERWAMAMCALLDRIELSADRPDQVRECCKARFELARRFGVTVEFGEATSGEMH